MLAELRELFAWVEDPCALRGHYPAAIDVANCLGKRSAKIRKLTRCHLVDLYGLNAGLLLFRALRFLWARDVTV